MEPERVVSLTPGSTEVLCGLGLTDRLVGVDDDSDYPPGVRSLPRVSSGSRGCSIRSCSGDRA